MADIIMRKAGISTNQVTSVARNLWKSVVKAYRRWEVKTKQYRKSPDGR